MPDAGPDEARPSGDGTWSYEEALAWLYGRQALGIKLGLGKVEALLERLGRPQDAFQSIHVAGTNGKGSVTRMLGNVLRHAGLRVGITTSPHLVSFTERIEVDGQPVDRQDVAKHLHAVRPHVEALDAAGQNPTFFEVVTALAFVHFKHAGVAWAVVETGMGGRLDATNVLAPRLTIITTIDLDHTAHLGPTVLDIAFEKAGIMKRRTPLVTAVAGQPLEVLKARSNELEVPMSIIGDDYHLVPGAGPCDPMTLLRPTGHSMHHVGLAGAHQRTNAAIVVAATDALRKQGVAIPERAVADALRTTTHPGRLETFRPPAGTLGPGAVEVLVDGAHNPAAAHALRRHLAHADFTGFHLVAGFCADKDWQECVDQLAPLAQHVWCVPVRNPRTLDPRALADYVAPSGIPVEVQRDAGAALRSAARAGATRILVAGSLFLAGEARAALTGQSLEEIRGSQ